VLLASNEQVGGVRTLTVGEAYLITVGAGKNEAVGQASMEEVGQGKTTNVRKTYTITVGDLLEIRVGKSSLTMDKEGKIALSGIEVNIEGQGPVKVLGKNVLIN
jgi:type VI secretion system secreted protein VgrG